MVAISALGGFAARLVPPGERNPRKSLVGNHRSEHLFTLKQSLQAYRYYRELMADCDREIERLIRQLNGKIDPPEKTLAPSSDPRVQKRSKNQFNFEMGPELNVSSAST